ncbi:uncharacterized protein [Haliotis cracherodii]|uniref:uncharacterized protein n=1 Tax=Haliotis cracherodii TaxID=6455 RepID=UPI0039EC8BA7
MPDRTKYSTRRVLFLLNAVVLVGASEKTCSPLSQLPVEEHSRLSGAVFDTFVTSGVVICAKECLSRHSCKSYNFNLDDGTCELSSEAGPGSNGSVSVTREAPFVFSKAHNWPQRILGVCKDHSCPNNTRCVAASDNGWECVTAYCTTPPTVRDAITSSPINDLTPVLQSLPLQCIVGYVACGNVTCNPEGTWITMTCMPVSNCTEVRQLSSTYTDGEYWLYPRQLSGSRVRVYCHAMNSTPSEYISLSTPYVMDATQAPYCTRFYYGYYGYYVFSKFGLDIQNMAINRSDTTFYKTDNRSDIHLSVGTVVGCSTVANSTCGPTDKVESKVPFNFPKEDFDFDLVLK